MTDERMRQSGKGRRKKAGKGPETLEVILRRWLKKNEINTSLGREQIDRRWEDTVGEAVMMSDILQSWTDQLLIGGPLVSPFGYC